MEYGLIGVLIIGIVLLVTGVKLNMNAPIAHLIRLALVLIGLVVISIGVLGIFSSIPSM